MEKERNSLDEMNDSLSSMGDLAKRSKVGWDKVASPRGSTALPPLKAVSNTGLNAAASSSSLGAGASAAGAGTSAAATSAATTATSSAAGAAGAATATTTGAAVGTSVGPVGTAVGAAVGALAGKAVKVIIVLLVFLMLVPYVAFSFPSIMFKNVIDENPIKEAATGVFDKVNNVWTWLNLSGSPLKTYVDSSSSLEESLLMALKDNMEKVKNEIKEDIQASQYEENLCVIDSFDDTTLDTSYILAAYSISQPYENQSKEDLFSAFVGTNFYSFEKEEKTKEILVPRTINQYKKVLLTVVENGVAVKKEVYVVSGTTEITEDIEIPRYERIEVVPQNPTEVGEYYVLAGSEKVTLEKKNVKYASYYISQNFDESLIHAWGFNPSDKLELFGEDTEMTKGEYARTLANNYMLAVFNKTYIGEGSAGGSGSIIGDITFGSQPSYSHQEIMDMVNKLDCSQNRKYLIYTAMSLVGRVPYFWAGRSAPGWNSEWGKVKPIPYAGNPKQPVGSGWPYGMDCSGYVSWVYKTVYGGNPLEDRTTYTMGDGEVATPIDFSQAKPGDILLRRTHTGIYLGRDPRGNVIVIHEAGTNSGCIISVDNNFTQMIRANGLDLEGSSIPWSYQLR